MKKDKEKKKEIERKDSEQIDQMVDEGGPSYSEELQDQLEPIWHPTEHDESDDLEDAKRVQPKQPEKPFQPFNGGKGG